MSPLPVIRGHNLTAPVLPSEQEALAMFVAQNPKLAREKDDKGHMGTGAGSGSGTPHGNFASKEKERDEKRRLKRYGRGRK
tara:strand:+ start:1066 stop:1308 length:243 start_codon:yes stop_codon:yes gene_type:complete